MNREKTDVLVIGAGPSGTIAAAIIRQSGFDVTIVEKTRFPRYVIGESLLPRCMEHFERAGFLEDLKRKNFQKKTGAVFLKDHTTCDFDFSEQFTKGWTWTWQVPRDDFDMALAHSVETRGVIIRYETEVINVDFAPANPVVSVKNKEKGTYEIQAKYIVDASGYGRVLPNLLGLNKPSDLPVRMSVFTQVDDRSRPGGSEAERILIIAHKPNVWGWIIPFSNGRTSIGFVGDETEITARGNTPGTWFQELMKETDEVPQRLRTAETLIPPKVIKGYSIGVSQLFGPRYVLTGNATEFLDPVFSSGVTFATESARIAGEMIVSELNGEPQDWQTHYQEHLLKGVDVFRVFINAWYNGTLQNIFFSEHIEQSIKNKICSILAGYVWDKGNPFVRNPKGSLQNLNNYILKHSKS